MHEYGVEWLMDTRRKGRRGKWSGLSVLGLISHWRMDWLPDDWTDGSRGVNKRLRRSLIAHDLLVNTARLRVAVDEEGRIGGWGECGSSRIWHPGCILLLKTAWLCELGQDKWPFREARDGDLRWNWMEIFRGADDGQGLWNRKELKRGEYEESQLGRKGRQKDTHAKKAGVYWKNSFSSEVLHHGKEAAGQS